jgi:hypothetical protein
VSYISGGVDTGTRCMLRLSRHTTGRHRFGRPMIHYICLFVNSSLDVYNAMKRHFKKKVDLHGNNEAINRDYWVNMFLKKTVRVGFAVASRRVAGTGTITTLFWPAKHGRNSWESGHFSTT